MPALDGMRILDMTQYEAGTSCTQMLAWLGADVVKIERPEQGDPGRRVGGSSAYFLNYNSNKRSVALSLRSEEGRGLLLQMAPKFDAFVENYGPGVMEKLGIDYDVMREINPRIIYARIKGFGLSGPYSSFNCYDQVAQASGGAFSVTGERGSQPLLSGATFADSGTGRAAGAGHYRRLRAAAAHRRGPADRALHARGGHDLHAHAGRAILRLGTQGCPPGRDPRRVLAGPARLQAGRSQRLHLHGDRHTGDVGRRLRDRRATRPPSRRALQHAARPSREP